MAYSTDVQGFSVFGNYKITWGKVTADSTTGNVDTELELCLALIPIPITAAESVNVTSTLPIAGSAVGTGTENNSDFYFVAIGV